MSLRSAVITSSVLLWALPQLALAEGQRYFLGWSNFSDGTVRTAAYVDLGATAQSPKVERIVDQVSYFAPSAEKLDDMPELAGGRVEERDAFQCETAKYRKLTFKVFDKGGRQTYSNVSPSDWQPVSGKPLISDVFELICKGRIYPPIPDQTSFAGHAAALFRGEIKPPSAAD